jgi:hypothetical protein
MLQLKNSAELWSLSKGGAGIYHANVSGPNDDTIGNRARRLALFFVFASQQRTTLDELMPRVAFRVSTTNWDWRTISP